MVSISGTGSGVFSDVSSPIKAIHCVTKTSSVYKNNNFLNENDKSGYEIKTETPKVSANFS